MKISTKQNQEVGVLVALVFLVLFLFFHESMYWVWFAISTLAITLIFPRFFQPLAFLWFGLSKVLGVIATTILLTTTFFIMVFPVGYLRRLLGKDTLQLKKFKRSEESVFSVREHTYEPNDVKHMF